MLSRFEKFIYNLSEMDLYWHRLSSSVMGSYGLKGSYVLYFLKLQEYPEGLTAARLCELCCKDKADVSRDLKALEKAGMVVKNTAGGSSYRAPIQLTEEGNKLTEIIKAKAKQAVEMVGKDLPESERETFYRNLDSIAENMRELSKKGIF